jgi:vesicle-fusing ATPase
MSLRLVAGNLPKNDLAFTNKVYVCPQDHARLSGGRSPVRVMIRGFPFNVEAHPDVEPETVGLNKIQRECARIGLKDEVVLEPLAKDPPSLGYVTAAVDFYMKPKQRVEVDADELAALFKSKFAELAFAKNQSIALNFQNQLVKFVITGLNTVAEAAGVSADKGSSVNVGLLQDVTEFDLVGGESGMMQLLSKKPRARNILRSDFNFEELGIGGLGKEFSDIFRRAFASRVYPPHILRELGINHVRGMVLWGPPGTGKTLIARKIANFLQAAEPKIVNGPEILSKFVGESEKNIRELFADAEKEYQQKGEDSQLHIIIFDELDAICKSRGSGRDGTGVHDSVVNQLLSKIDGVEALNNILLIGMTNRKDMLDEALLRPGRLEVHVEISLPDEAGRVEILSIHTARMRKANYLAKDVNLPDIAKRTKNFSGAEIEGLVRSATSWAFNRKINVQSLTSGGEPDLSDIQVTNDDFDVALADVQPAFGQHEDELEAFTGPISDFAPAVTQCKSTLRLLTQQVRDAKTGGVMSVLIDGAVGAGKTTLAGYCARIADFPFIRAIVPDKFIGMTELAKVNAIQKIFDDAWKSQVSVIILDDLERLCEYVQVGPRFSNLVLQAVGSPSQRLDLQHQSAFLSGGQL